MPTSQKYQYPLGPDGKYGSASCVITQNVLFYESTDVEIQAIPPQPYSPSMKTVYNQERHCYEMEIVFFAPIGVALDADKPIVCEFMGAEFFLFVNLDDKDAVHESQQCFLIRVSFTETFSLRLKGKKIFVLPIHGDPQEGEITKELIDDEDEV